MCLCAKRGCECWLFVGIAGYVPRCEERMWKLGLMMTFGRDKHSPEDSDLSLSVDLGHNTYHDLKLIALQQTHATAQRAGRCGPSRTAA